MRINPIKSNPILKKHSHLFAFFIILLLYYSHGNATTLPDSPFSIEPISAIEINSEQVVELKKGTFSATSLSLQSSLQPSLRPSWQHSYDEYVVAIKFILLFIIAVILYILCIIGIEARE